MATASWASRCGAQRSRTRRAGRRPRLRLFAGCGIVAGSDPEAEIAESEAKLDAVRRALQP